MWVLAVLYAAVGDARERNRDGCCVFFFSFLDTYLGSFGLVCFGSEWVKFCCLWSCAGLSWSVDCTWIYTETMLLDIVFMYTDGYTE